MLLPDGVDPWDAVRQAAILRGSSAGDPAGNAVGTIDTMLFRMVARPFEARLSVRHLARVLLMAPLLVLAMCGSPRPERRAHEPGPATTPPNATEPIATDTKVEVASPFESALPLGAGVSMPSIIQRADLKTFPAGAPCRGLVMMELIVDEGGAVIAIRDTSPNPDAFTAGWVESMKESRFRPGMRDGTPVRVRFSYLVHIRCAR